MKAFGSGKLRPRRFARLVVHAALLAGCNNAARPTIAQDSPSATPTTATSLPASASSSGASAAAPSDGAKLQFVPATADSDALSLIRTKRLEAKAEGRVLVVYVGATWCGPCVKMKEEIHAGRLDARLAKTTLLAFDADRDAERLASAGYTFKFIPYVALPGADGHPAESEEARGKGSAAWRELLGKLDAWQGAGPR